MFSSVNPDPETPVSSTPWGVILVVGGVGLAFAGLVTWSFLYGPLGAPDPVASGEMSTAGARGLGKIIAAFAGLGVAGLGALVRGSAQS